MYYKFIILFVTNNIPIFIFTNNTYLYILVKTKSIKDIEKSTIQVNIENKELEKQLIDKKSKIIETRDNIVRYIIIFNVVFAIYKYMQS